MMAKPQKKNSDNINLNSIYLKKTPYELNGKEVIEKISQIGSPLSLMKNLENFENG